MRRRTRRRRLLVVLALLAALKVVHGTFGERAWTGALSLFWERRCLSYRVPAERLAYVAASRGWALPPYLSDFSGAVGSSWDGTIGAPPYPIELAEYQRLIAPRPGVPWEALPAPVFLHGLRDASGRQRLVAVYALANNPSGWWTLVATVRDPLGIRAGSRDAARPPPVLSTACWPLPKTLDDALAVYAGQPDRSDPSRFTLRVCLNGRDQIVTGVLRDDATVTFTSDTGLTPWGTNKAGPIVVPRVAVAPQEGGDNVLLPVD